MCLFFEARRVQEGKGRSEKKVFTILRSCYYIGSLCSFLHSQRNVVCVYLTSSRPSSSDYKKRHDRRCTSCLEVYIVKKSLDKKRETTQKGKRAPDKETGEASKEGSEEDRKEQWLKMKSKIIKGSLCVQSNTDRKESITTRSDDDDSSWRDLNPLLYCNRLENADKKA